MYKTGEKRKTKDGLVRVGITHGDLNGIGYEIIIKTFRDQRILEDIVPVIYGSSKIASYHRKTLGISEVNFNLIKAAEFANPKRANIVNIFHQEVRIELGKSTAVAGELSYLALKQAVSDLQDKHIDVVVTGPINKKNIQSKEFEFPGHTEYFAQKFQSEEYLMLMVSQSMRVGVATGHIPLKNVPESLSTESILKKIKVLNQSLRIDFAITKPKIAILGLNPHAGDHGLLGSEENDIIIPAIEMAKDEGILAFGPYPADGFFASGEFKDFDAILAMYHDQGLVPFKALAFDSGVNFTAGLPIVRTSPAHGTAYEIAGKNEASHISMQNAIYLAQEIFRNRQEYAQLTSKPVPTHLKHLSNRKDHVDVQADDIADEPDAEVIRE